MRQLSLDETKNLVGSYAKSYGQRGTARALNDQGYRSPEGYPLQQPHIARVLSGGCTRFLAPEEGEDQQQQPPAEPIDSSPKRRKEIAAEIFEDEEQLKKEIIEIGQELKEELLAEEAALQEMEAKLPPLIPSIGEHIGKEARHLERDIRVSAVFDRRADVELDEEATFYGIPKMMRKVAEVRSRPYQPRRYGQNVISSRDLSIRKK